MNDLLFSKPKVQLKDVKSFFKRDNYKSQLILLIITPIISIYINYYLSNRLGNEISSVASYVIANSIIYIIILGTLFIFNLVNHIKEFDKDQLRLILYVTLLYYFLSSYLTFYIGGLLNNQILGNDKFLFQVDRFGATSFINFLLTLVFLICPLLTVILAFYMNFNFKEIKRIVLNFDFHYIKLISFFGLIFLSFNLIVFPNFLRILLVVLFFALLTEKRTKGHRLVATILSILAFMTYYSSSPNVDMSKIKLVDKPFSTPAFVFRQFNIQGLDYIFLLIPLFLILVSHYRISRAETTRQAALGTLQMISIFYLVFLFSSSGLFSNLSYDLLSQSSDYFLNNSFEYFGFSKLYLSLFFVVGIIYLVYLAYSAISVADKNSRYSVLALASFLISPFSLITFGAASFASIVLAHLARAEIKRSNGILRGSGLTVFALTPVYVGLAFFPLISNFFF